MFIASGASQFCTDVGGEASGVGVVEGRRRFEGCGRQEKFAVERQSKQSERIEEIHSVRFLASRQDGNVGCLLSECEDEIVNRLGRVVDDRDVSHGHDLQVVLSERRDRPPQVPQDVRLFFISLFRLCIKEIKSFLSS